MLKSFLRLIFISIAITLTTSGMAQNSLLNSTLDSAKNLRNTGNFSQAIKVLENFDKQYPGNLWVLQLYAETLFWMKEYDKADNAYRRAIRIYPNNFDVKYEYALFLYNQERYDEAKELLLLYNNNQPDNAVVLSLLGITSYYLGDFKEAENYLGKSQKLNPDDKRTNEIYREVSHIVKPWVKGTAEYSNDSQPISLWQPSISGGWYYSHFLNLSITANYQNFSADSIISNMTGLNIQNSFIFPKAGFKANISAGYVYTFVNRNIDYTWGLMVDQKISKHIHIKLEGERSPYTYTIASINKPFLRNRYSASLSMETSESWNADIGYIGEYFPDTNSVQTAYAWLLSPVLKFSVFKINIGYAFNYSNSNESRYMPEQSLDEILTDYDSLKRITGVYDPYFTPHNQFSNSVLANIFIAPTKNLNIKLHASVGVFARAMNPYFYLGKTNGTIKIERDFYKESFTPMDLGIDLNADLSDKIQLDASYQYLQTFYYNTNNFKLGLKIFF